MNYYSQFQQDKFVYENYFTNKVDGYFVDIGAADGIKFSNSKFFEELGWKVGENITWIDNKDESYTLRKDNERKD